MYGILKNFNLKERVVEPSLPAFLLVLCYCSLLSVFLAREEGHSLSSPFVLESVDLSYLHMDSAEMNNFVLKMLLRFPLLVVQCFFHTANCDRFRVSF